MRTAALVSVLATLSSLLLLSNQLNLLSLKSPELLNFRTLTNISTSGGRITKATQEDAERTEAWQIFKEVVSADNPKDSWDHWSTKCYLAPDVPLSTGAKREISLTPICDELEDKNSAAELESTRLTREQSVNEFHLASVFFNAKAGQSILDQGLSLTQDYRNTSLLTGDTSGKPIYFQNGSIFVKAIWEAVDDSSGKWPVKVYDPSSVLTKPGDKTTLLPLDMRPSGDTRNQLFLTLGGCRDQSGKQLQDIAVGNPVPIGCFYGEQVTPTTPGARYLTISSQPAPSNYYLLLVGMHIAKRESDHWKWMTFWWTNRPTYYGNDGKPQGFILPDQYAHFVVDTTTTDGTACFNPYLEGPQKRGTETNCVHCHSQAAIRVGPNHKICQSNPGIGLPGADPPDPNCNVATWTNSIWTVVTSHDQNPPPDLSLIRRRK